MSWTEYCKICGDRVPVDNYMEGDGSLRAESGKEEQVKRLQNKAKTSTKPKSVPAPKKPTALVTDVRTPGKGAGRPPGGKTKVQQKDNFLRNKLSPGAVTTETS